MPARVWVVMPTYNEADNIEGIVRAVLTELDRLAPGDHSVLVVDDSSPDGTGEIADKLALELPAVQVLHRTVKSGLGHAYLAGFAKALQNGAEVLIEMDADFSHDPRYLGDLLAAVKRRDHRRGDDARRALGEDARLRHADRGDVPDRVHAGKTCLERL